MALMSASGLPSITCQLSQLHSWHGNPSLLCSACLSAHTHTETRYPGPPSGPSTHRLSLFSAVSTFPVRLGHAHVGVPGCSLVAPAILPKVLPFFTSCGLIVLNIDFGSAATSLLSWLAPRTQAKADPGRPTIGKSS